MAETSQVNESLDSIYGRLVIDLGLATEDEVRTCVDLHHRMLDGEAANPPQLPDLLVSEGVVTKAQIDRLQPLIRPPGDTPRIPGYTILKQLGAGAMATVHLAKQLSLDRMVAIKILPEKFTGNPEFVKRFYAEGRAAAKLNHPNIVGALDVGKAGDTHFFAMEYVEGRTVYDDITANQRYSEQEALKIITQVARALEHAHKAGLIHRDVKPKNIMITTDGKAKLADMGLARAVSDREAAIVERGKAFGTPYYISPEQIRGDSRVDFRADIYSLGVTLYHMVTGKVPFKGETPSVVMQKHIKEELIPPDHVNPNLSAGLSEIIEVCLAKEPGQRYDSTSGLIEDLECVARGEPPMIARKKFDVVSLQALGATAEQEAPAAKPKGRRVTDKPSSIFTKPMFWIALGGWVTAAALIYELAARTQQ